MKVGEGKLMVCSADLQSDPQARVAARQLLFSIKRYMASEQFNPAQQVELAVIEDLFTEKNREKLDIRTSDSPDELKPKLKPKP